MIPRRIQELEGFGTKNVLLISGVALVLFVFAISQRPFSIGNANQLAKTPKPIAVNSDNSSTTSSNGAVLGAVGYDKDLAATFASIEVKTTADNSIDALKNYGAQINIVAENDNISDLLSLDKGQQSNAGGNKFLEDLSKIYVPDSLADYHRMLLAYYGLRFATQDEASISNVSPADMNSVETALATQLANLRDSYKISGVNLLAGE